MAMAAPTAVRVRVSGETLTVDLSDGRSLAVPTARFPRLLHGSQQERDTWRLIGDGAGIHWPMLDEDISVAGLLAGQPSGESRASLRHWLEERQHAQATSMA
jgi:hypothetical protein